MDPRVWDAMQVFFQEDFGNPVSVHSLGQRAEAAMENARLKIANLLNAKPDEVIFTSGGTESDNLALRGSAFSARKNRGANHILISAVEHDAIIHTAEQLADIHEFEIELIPVDRYGRVSPSEVASRLRDDTAIVSIVLANNEVGTVNPIREISQICRERGVLLHTDAVQAGAYLPIDMHELGADMLSLGAHKFYGPKGAGILYIRKGTKILPIQTGGGHEFGMRAGTQNTAYIAAMARAYEIVRDDIEERATKMRTMRDSIIQGVLSNIPDSLLSGHPAERLPNHASFVFKGVDGNALLMLLDSEGYACSSGSACKTGDPEPSEILTAMGLEREWALGSLRVTIGVHSRQDEIDEFVQALPAIIDKARALELA
jgi:cysteine desulfurase